MCPFSRAHESLAVPPFSSCTRTCGGGFLLGFRSLFALHRSLSDYFNLYSEAKYRDFIILSIFLRSVYGLFYRLLPLSVGAKPPIPQSLKPMTTKQSSDYLDDHGAILPFTAFTTLNSKRTSLVVTPRATTSLKKLRTRILLYWLRL